MDLFDQNELHHAPFTIQNMTFKRKNFIWLNIPLILKTLNTWQTIKCMQSDLSISLDQNKLFVSESLVPLTQLAKWYKEPTIQFLEL